MKEGRQLIVAAEALLGGAKSQLSGARVRASALLARQAIEDCVRHIWTHHSKGMASCPTRAQLRCLEVAGMDTGLARQVRSAWGALSTACHHHPYEVAPSLPELLDGIRAASQLEEFVTHRYA